MLISIFLFIPQLKAQDNDREFGVLVIVNNTKSGAMEPTINNIKVCTLQDGDVIFHKYYSEGQILFSIGAYLTNFSLKYNDTIFIEFYTKRFIKKLNFLTKDDFDVKFSKFPKFYSSERITYPYIPESFEKSKKKGKRSGSGFLLSQEGYIATNYHVIENTKKVVARGVNGNKNSSLSLKVVYTDSINDLAILKLEDKINIDKPIYSFKSTTTDVGENIFVLGYPLTEAMGEDIKLTDGLVSSKNGFKGDTSSYQISAPVQPGNSGAPLFDKNGNIVGIVNAKLRGAENATYAIKVNFLQTAINKAGVVINTNQSGLLTGKSLPQQVKAIQDFVYIIEAE